MDYSRYTNTVVISDTDVVALVEQMRLLLVQGWEPLGPLAQLGKQDTSGSGLVRGQWFVAMARTRPLTEYQILEAPTNAQLKSEVEGAMSTDDWRLVGGVSISIHPDDGSIYAQAMER
jgi:hypothetical protein